MNYELLIIPAAYLLDLVFGDPQWYWHPVRLIGRLTEKLENKLNLDGINKKLGGAVLVILVVGATVFCVWGVLRLTKFIHPFFYYGVSALFIYFSLSIKSLSVEAGKVYKDLKSGDIQRARDNLSMVVGRDTKGLDEPEIIRASVETVAESIMDGIIAPLFYAFLGGPVLVWAYKAINTLDSMVGYKNERFIEFGRASALLDGMMNFIPAKITCFLISISSLCYGKNWLNSFKQGSKYFFQGPKINSESTEAAMAGGLNIRLGGINFYNSIPVRKPLIGGDLQPLAIEHIQQSIRIAYISSALMLISGVMLK
ncbi:MAG: adenosylcobinamide-phosphate synthase CbiB [bacterium]